MSTVPKHIQPNALNQNSPNARRNHIHLRSLFLLITRRSLKQIRMRLQLEIQIGNVDEQKQDRRPAGDGQKTRKPDFVPWRLVLCEEILEWGVMRVAMFFELGRMVGGGNHQRY